ncbi:MAG: signal peptidase II [Bacteroidetes bacterium]|nr:signal peptidase II [Bacteroidota bacterium]
MVILLDQSTKLLVKGFTIPLLNYYYEGMQLGESIPVLGDFLRITFVENAGIVFGMEVTNRILLIAVTFIAICVLLYYLYTIRKEPFIVQLPFALILGGALGNFIDRAFYGIIFGEAPLFYGRVVDFIDVDFFDLNLFGYQMSRWAVFNVADASVSLGVILMLVFFRKIEDTAKHNNQGPVVQSDSAPEQSPTITP